MFFSKVDQNYFYLCASVIISNPGDRIILANYPICLESKPYEGVSLQLRSNHSCADSSHLDIRDWDRNTNPQFFNYLHFGKKKTKSMLLEVIERGIAQKTLTFTMVISYLFALRQFSQPRTKLIRPYNKCIWIE